MYCSPPCVIQYFLIMSNKIRFSLATRTFTLLHRKKTFSQSRSSHRWNLNILFSLVWTCGGGDGGVEGRGAWHRHCSTSFQPFPSYYSWFFSLARKGAFWPICFFQRVSVLLCLLIFSSLPFDVLPGEIWKHHYWRLWFIHPNTGVICRSSALYLFLTSGFLLSVISTLLSLA